MPSPVEPSSDTFPVKIPKPFAYFCGGLVVGAVCVLLPFLCILPLALQQARVSDQLHQQVIIRDAEIARLQQLQNQRRPPPSPFSDSYPPPPPPNDGSSRPPQRPPFDHE